MKHLGNLLWISILGAILLTVNILYFLNSTHSIAWAFGIIDVLYLVIAAFVIWGVTRRLHRGDLNRELDPH